MSVEGIWDLSVATPLGSVAAVVELRRGPSGLTGLAHGAGEEVPLREVESAGDLLTWKQSVTKPLRLNLSFSVTVEGDTLHGTSRAGRLPASKVSGVRRPAGPGAGR
ncbi:hypothetical protein G3I40_29480 [Streptomyces sp. SID14478]|uniref:hypothetical protein n=1 Tax=Streptomyces sp. SID14478 TaxID=2706073 RepID=UPI0013DB8681|nr:hypothetical protein [Streptomyces sp. SID14478]NEB79319.1 hypothetical protein [Streptomyces sp. SID14478]